jgi:hypothetical protein
VTVYSSEYAPEGAKLFDIGSYQIATQRAACALLMVPGRSCHPVELSSHFGNIRPVNQVCSSPGFVPRDFSGYNG